MFQDITVKKFKDLDFEKEQLPLFQEVVGLAHYGTGLLLIKNPELVNKESLKESKIFSKDVTFQESFKYFKEVLEVLGLEGKTFEIWGKKVFYKKIPLSNLNKKDITPGTLENITNILANQYATIWQEKIDTFYNYDSILYENLINQPLEDIAGFVYLKIYEKEHALTRRW